MTDRVDELLREARERVAIDDLVERQALDRAREQLRALSTPKQAPRRKQRFRPLLLLAVLAAVVVVVLAFPPSSLVNDITRLGPAPASARTVLSKIARRLEHRGWHPLGAGDYFYFKEEQGTPRHGGSASRRATSTEEGWISADGFAKIVQHGAGGGDVLIFGAARGQLAALRGRHALSVPRESLDVSRQGYRWAGVDYRQLIDLPTDVPRLRAWIQAHSVGQGPTASNILVCAVSLTEEAPMPPKLIAALYHVISTLPDMKLVGPTRDPLGRRGVAISFTRGARDRLELIFDPRTGMLLGTRTVALSKQRRAAAGQVIAWSAISSQAIVHTDRARPT